MPKSSRILVSDSEVMATSSCLNVFQKLILLKLDDKPEVNSRQTQQVCIMVSFKVLNEDVNFRLIKRLN